MGGLTEPGAGGGRACRRGGPFPDHGGGWTSDLAESAELFARYRPHLPERAEQMRPAARTGRTPTADPAVLPMLVDDLAPWLAAEHIAVHGEKAPRP
ncbi:hypothetical protein [Streptomyces sp. NPDC050422]|uniref:hypothetical protein n=1 Tax=Streptomyces sp. NPDC050422 TaxID=3365614 RepID=UPI003794C346